MVIDLLRLLALLLLAVLTGKLVSMVRLPAILGWLIAGVVFGPYLLEIVTFEMTEALWYRVLIKVLECCAGVMIGREIIFRNLKKSGKQIVGITAIQSLGTFLFVTLVFAIAFRIAGVPVYLAFIFGGIALATAPAPALSIVREYKADGPVTRTLIPLAAIDDIIGVIVFFTVISVISGMHGGASTSPLTVVGMVLFPFVICAVTGWLSGMGIRKTKSANGAFTVFLLFLFLSAGIGFCIDYFLFHALTLNYLLIGMAYSMVVANLVPEETLQPVLKKYNPILSVSLIVVIVNLGLPLNYRLIAGAGLYTFLYILSRAAGKIGFSYLGGKVTKAEPTVTKYLGLTLLPHSGVSLVFTGIAVSTLNSFAPELGEIVSGTIVAAAILNEIIAVIVSKKAFQAAGEIGQGNDA